MQEPMVFNGIDARSGEPLTPDLTFAEIANIARGAQLDKVNLREPQPRARQHGVRCFAVKEGVDPKRIDETGWGVIFPYAAANSEAATVQSHIREALRPLLDLRKSQANRKGEYYKEYVGVNAYRPDETKQKFLARLGAGPGPVDPSKVPYYLLIVASPEEMPFSVQYQIDVQYAVGRIHFDSVEEYANYARSVVRVETGGLVRPRRAAFFGVANPGDKATEMSSQHLVTPLADTLAASEHMSDWSLDRHLGAAATKAQLASLLGGTETPALLFTASHGMGFPKGDPLQFRHQGALLCQDWPGPTWKKAIPEDFYFSGDDVASNANLLGLIAFNFACYGAGTPQFDEFSKRAGKQRAAIAERPFVAGLQRRLLGHPGGGALAAIGHVERAWGYSFMWEAGGSRSVGQLAVFESMMKRLMEGHPVGSAVEYFNERYAELSSDLSEQLEQIEFGAECDARELAELWTSNNDARAYAVIGDPAVRLQLTSAADSTRLESQSGT